jgi:hypothetical protein
MFRTAALLLTLGCTCFGWHDPHVAITRAAIRSLPASDQQWLGPEAEHIIEIYCWNPDRYFNVAAAERAAMRVYCERPDGARIHNVTWERKEDLATLEYLFSELIARLRAGRRTEAAQFAGTMAHLVEDSLSPAHALDMKIMQDLLPPPMGFRESLHAAIEFSAPAPDVAGRSHVVSGASVPDVASAILDRIYDGVHENRTHLIEIVRAVYAGDEATLDRFRASAALTAAEILADAYHAAFRLAGQLPPAHTSLAPRADVNPGSDTPAPGRNLLAGVRYAIAALAIDKQALRTPLGGVRAATTADGGVIISGNWPPYEGVQELHLYPGTQRAVDHLETAVRNRADYGTQFVKPNVWVRTVDHRGDPLFELILNGSGDISLRNHKNQVCAISAGASGLSDAALVSCSGAPTVVVHAR